MKHDRINYVVVGVFVIASFGLLLWFLSTVSGKSGPADQYHVVYDNVSGLRFGTRVFYEGYLVGQVEAITPIRKAEGGAGTVYQVDFSVQQGWSIPEDSEARVTASGLLGQISIEIREGSAKTALTPGDEIKGQTGGSMMAAINDVAGEMRSLARDVVRPMLTQLSQRVDSVSGALEKSLEGLADTVNLENRQNLSALLANIRESTETMKEAAEAIHATATSTRELVSEVNKGTVTDILDDFAVTAHNAATLSAELHASRQRLDSTLGQLHEAVAENRPELRDAIADLRTTMHIVVGNIDNLMQQLDSTSRNLNDFSRQVKRNPAALIRGDYPEANR
ncbi:MAG: MCE family protein [Gammaproteobacteria bacterium]|nr:MCE family protein [Gammaproteobacteria bacterium]MCP5135519.1 MCE family protein [Gammaproteobacteria bacterium]